VLVTGSAGFVGGAVGEVLAAADHEVIPVDVMLPEAHGEAASFPTGTHRLDVRDAGSWTRLLRGVYAVCHQAALVGAGVTAADLPSYASHNDLGTAALLAAMHEAGVARLVLASSMVVYGEGHHDCPVHGVQRPPSRTAAALDAGDFDHHCRVCADPLEWGTLDEDDRLDPRNGYAASKVAQEQYAAAWARQTGGSVVALRYHNVYGPRMPRDTPYSGVAAMFRSSLERGEPPRVLEDGRQMRDFVHVSDVARANLAALEALAGQGPGDCPLPDRRGGCVAYNVCSGRPIPIREVAEKVACGTGIVPVVTGGYRLTDVRHVVASPERAARELGFRAAVPPEVGLPRFAGEPLRG
jgi:dTDP-L-rhamnose 4-epimerase